MKKLLSLDLSTTCTGYALFSLEDRQLLKYGFIKPRVKNPTKKGIPLYSYPKLQTLKMRDITEQIKELINAENPQILAIEEIVGHKSRLTGKVLDGLHFILIDRILDFEGQIKYIDVSGTNGWRPRFEIRLSELDKTLNKQAKALNNKTKKGEKKVPLVDWKTLSSRYVNKKFKLTLDPVANAEDGDVADAIMVGLCLLDFLEKGN